MRRGQTIVVVVLSLVALLAMVGLALDSSRVYQTRRVLQNAADSAALAGTQELAINRTATTLAAIWRKVADYLQRNGADANTAQAWLVQDSTRLMEITQSANTSAPPANANGVEVLSQRVVPVLFGGILGRSQVPVQASARANTGNLQSLPPRNNVVPITVHYEIVRNAHVGDELTVWDGYQVTVQPPAGSPQNYGDTGNPYSGWLNLAWIHNSDEDSDTDNDEDDDNDDEDGDGDVEDDDYDDGDDIDDINENREIDQSHSQANVNDWIMNGNPYRIVSGSLMGTDGDFIMGDPGIRASGLQALEEKRQQLIRQGERPIFYFVVFDRYFDHDGMQRLFPTHSAVPGSHGDCAFPNSLYFHVMGFVAIEVTEVRWQGGANSQKYVRGNFVSFVQTGDLNDGSGFTGDDEMVKTVTLTK